MTEKEKAAVAYLNKIQNEKNVFTNIGRDEIVAAENFLEKVGNDMEKREYELTPVSGQKSFYGKARVRLEPNGAAVLISYTTPVLRREPSGVYVRLWSGWSATTGKHIRAFAGIGKAEWDKMPVETRLPRGKMSPDMSAADSYRAMIARRIAG